MRLLLFKKYFSGLLLLVMILLAANPASTQTNLLLNGNFEDINICTEYNAECGVEAWFYLRDIKAQMLSNESGLSFLGNNSFGVSFPWRGFTGFSPVIGTILPCRLQQGSRYTFKGIYKVVINDKLICRPGMAIGKKFYVIGRPFADSLRNDSILQVTKIPDTDLYQFEYNFIATGDEKYLTFGTYIAKDTSLSKQVLYGQQTVALILDNFQLIPDNKNEDVCVLFEKQKEKIYAYNYRHKEMDYSLYGKGEVIIPFDEKDSNFITHIIPPGQQPKIILTDTLRLGDVLFDFNKAALKNEAIAMLQHFFSSSSSSTTIDKIFVEGHTDSVGSARTNLQLSKERCESVLQWLNANNIAEKESILIHPFGKTRPIATNKTAAGRALNRRVEIIIFHK